MSGSRCATGDRTTQPRLSTASPATPSSRTGGAIAAPAAASRDEPLTVASLAAQANLSARTLIRRFHAVTGTTPMSWLLSVRVNHARELLETTTLPVTQIAERCGMGSPANFRHHFARAVGTFPSVYRRTFAASD